MNEAMHPCVSQPYNFMTLDVLDDLLRELPSHETRGVEGFADFGGARGS
ncbi:MAG: hypothetical protein HC923_00910 [Myxococcales bacterium]|nr:hypothetical protein [Myxococcales bacterium]